MDRGRLAWSLAVGGVAATVAFAVAAAVLLGLGGWNWENVVGLLRPEAAFGPLLLTAPVGAFLAGCSLWYVAVERPGSAGAAKGAIVGAGIASAAHPLMWLGSGVATTLARGRVLPTEPTGFVFGPIGVVLFVLAATIWSLLLFGWATVPVGAVAGAGLGALRARSIDRVATEGGT